ncbi:MAG: hypothetical protein J3T61_01415 [Candidatus Brocadiales bacterium]|nr:hypothetical protein [Candidatus Bathyanammoxibius sp.]
MTKDTGGPAFSRPATIIKRGEITVTDIGAEGMTLLDYYAGEAMKEIQRREPDAHRVAVLAYEQAEEMVKEKRKREATHEG